MAAYSPISSRNHRISAPPYHISSTANSANSTTATASGAAVYNVGGTQPNTFHGNLSGSSRRRESINSSIGATSIRRLLTVNRGCRHKISSHVRAKIAKNFSQLIIAHGLMCAVLIPLFGLQVFLFLQHCLLFEHSLIHKERKLLTIHTFICNVNCALLS